ncbi:MAG: carcinine hydrolase/isopenicillin-N N-acyltransferase family protein [Microthrixaceae bacterium]
MCDTMVSLTEHGVLFAKNSDRDPNEAQHLDWQPSTTHVAGTPLRCTWIDVPQVARTHAVLLSRPWWMWGAEMGANEHGVVIGNEAVFTRQPKGDTALLGMDLVRLALERASSADAAVQVIVSLLEAHGQGGSCSQAHPGFTYHNSFLVADPRGAVVLETAGREWATEPVRGPGRSISNGLTIPAFARAHRDPLRSRVAACDLRRALTEPAAARAVGPADLMAVLRSHGDGVHPSYSPVNGAMSAPCMHAGGLVTASQTTGSWVADLRGAPLHWVTGTAAPCTSLFMPVQVEVPVDTGPRPDDRADLGTRWWRHERLHRLALRDLGASLARRPFDRDRLERSWIDRPPTAPEAMSQADELTQAWWRDLRAADLPDRRPAYVRRYWRRQDRLAGLDPMRADDPVGTATPAGTGT